MQQPAAIKKIEICETPILATDDLKLEIKESRNCPAELSGNIIKPLVMLCI
ncbi:MAG: hypothetical protein K9N06_02905 [Candidatus Cloacimonetes bacterium]|nr:hypothetical protein [Candidatus Cloacimonadota bacterium]